MTEDRVEDKESGKGGAAFAQIMFFMLGTTLMIGIGVRYSNKYKIKELPILGQVDDFSFEESQGGRIERKKLLGQVWVAGFIFTRCSGPCPIVSASMASLQRDPELRALKLVSFSVDPSFDTAEVLKTYASNFGAEPERWYLVRGQQVKLYELIFKSFHLPVEEGKQSVPVGSRFSHSSRLVLVDRQGRIRGYYESTTEEGMKKLRGAAKILLKGTSK